MAGRLGPETSLKARRLTSGSRAAPRVSMGCVSAGRLNHRDEQTRRPLAFKLSVGRPCWCLRARVAQLGRPCPQASLPVRVTVHPDSNLLSSCVSLVSPESASARASGSGFSQAASTSKQVTVATTGPTRRRRTRVTVDSVAGAPGRLGQSKKWPDSVSQFTVRRPGVTQDTHAGAGKARPDLDSESGDQRQDHASG